MPTVAPVERLSDEEVEGDGASEMVVGAEDVAKVVGTTDDEGVDDVVDEVEEDVVSVSFALPMTTPLLSRNIPSLSKQQFESCVVCSSQQ